MILLREVLRPPATINFTSLLYRSFQCTNIHRGQWRQQYSPYATMTRTASYPFLSGRTCNLTGETVRPRLNHSHRHNFTFQLTNIPVQVHESILIITPVHLFRSLGVHLFHEDFQHSTQISSRPLLCMKIRQAVDSLQTVLLHFIGELERGPGSRRGVWSRGVSRGVHHVEFHLRPSINTFVQLYKLTVRIPPVPPASDSTCFEIVPRSPRETLRSRRWLLPRPGELLEYSLRSANSSPCCTHASCSSAPEHHHPKDENRKVRCLTSESVSVASHLVVAALKGNVKAFGNIWAVGNCGDYSLRHVPGHHQAVSREQSPWSSAHGYRCE